MSSGLVSDFSLLVFQTRDAGAHLPDEGEAENNQQLLPPTESGELRCSQETDLDDFEKLSGQSESHCPCTAIPTSLFVLPLVDDLLLLQS
jgi:hypothetical protein